MKKRIIITLAIFVAAALIGTAVFFTVKNAAAQNASNKTEKKESQQVREEEHITSAVEFFGRPDVFIPLSEVPDSIRKQGTDKIVTYKGQKYYFGTVPGFSIGAMLILTEDQSRELLTAPDIAEISFFQSECLPYMVKWRRVYTDYHPGDIYRNIYEIRRIFYYFFDDRTVVVANDLFGLGPLNGDGARIEVIANGSDPGFLIPEEGAEKAEQGTYYDSYFEYIVNLENRRGSYQTDNP